MAASRQAALAQLVRAPDCGSGGPPFDPERRYHRKGLGSHIEAAPLRHARSMATEQGTGELLIVGPSWLGDAMMMGVLVQRLKAAEPARRITVLTPPHLEELVRRLPGVDAALGNPFAHGALKLGERARFGRSL